MEVYAAINAVQADLALIGISKDKKNTAQGYNFRGIDDVYGALAPLLAKHKLCIIPFTLNRSVVERATKLGGVLFYVTVECDFHFVSAVDGSTHIARTFGEAMDSGDKATNKAMSAAYKYAAFQTFCIPVDSVDADGDPPADVVPQKPITPQPTPADTAKISAAQRSRFYAIAKGTGYSDQEIKDHLLNLGYEHTIDILKSKYDDLCKWAEAKEREPGDER